MDIENLNFKNVFVCAQGVEVAANAIKALGKPEYEPGIAALLRLAHDLYDRGAMQAQREGIKPRPLKEVQAALAKAARKFVN